MPRKPTGTLFYRICKRTFDIAFSAGCAAVLAIPMACVCAAICVESPGCPVYTQERVGRGGQVIRVLKLRSMVSDAGDVQKYLSPEQLHQWKVERKVDNDPLTCKPTCLSSPLIANDNAMWVYKCFERFSAQLPYGGAFTKRRKSVLEFIGMILE